MPLQQAVLNNMKLKVQNAPNLERDSDSNGIVSTDHDGYLQLCERRKAYRASQERLNKLEREVCDVKALQLQTNALLQNLINTIKQ